MDSQIKQVKESHKLIKRTDDNISRLENMLESVFQQVDEVVGFEKVMREGEENAAELKKLVGDIEKRLEYIQKEKKDVENCAKDRERLFNLLDRAHEDTEKVLGQNQLIQEAQSVMKNLIEEIHHIKVDSKNISAKQDSSGMSAQG